ncbi:PSD1 and planctomycete cytochrome C domain-containing protein [Aeoliella mucimassa]|uniref:Planctomycete cytochrome C n=1 Tax=Aeoliella mucimassa TaxID=2527972 RepID=A0A518AML4_9BACT|nr:PSD1 and planctomycete cytochrome C domain-containing protein [Aeoliella mucimassa]QDU55946.1 Planctomycete cytochrome C [Aeoliella mucimassa]
MWIGPRLWMQGASLSICLLATSLVSFVQAEDRIDFNRQIRPLLSDRCYQCHGPDENHREAGLRLDLEEAATAETDSGTIALVPGDTEASELVARIATDDADLVMPPVDSGKSLNAEEIALLKKWVEQGAKYQPHWAFVAPKVVAPAEVKQAEWPAGEIDKYILAEIEAAGLEPSPEANKITLIRRVTLDLTGLPPTPEEVAAFLADDSADAYEKVVDRLLASPRYGEHMARFWLDAVRYGDTHGLHLDNYREMWPYRDWVVRAFNDNLTWDQFTRMNLAGDLLPEPSLDDLIASGYNRSHITTNEGGSIAEEVRVRNVVDRVSTTGTVFMGLTMGCAVCHDHKFDPITMRDFYAMSGFFNNLDANPMDGNRADHAPTVKAPTPEQQTELARLEQRLKELATKLDAPWQAVDTAQAEWETKTREQLASQAKPELVWGTWHSVGPFRSDLRYLQGQKQGPEGKPVKLDDQFELSTGEKVAWVAHPEWADGEPHTEFEQIVSAMFVYRTIESDQARAITVGVGSDDGVRIYLNGKKVHDKRTPRGVTVNEDQVTLKLKQGTNELLMKIVNHGGGCGFAFSVPEGNELPAEVIAAVNVEPAARTDEHQRTLRQYYRMQISDDAGIAELLDERSKVEQEKVAVESAIPTTLIMKERAEVRPTYVLTRGQYDTPDKEQGALPRRVPEFLPSLPDDAPKDRLGLANWLLTEQQPLMARVTVNRFWQQLFGIGLVETSDDFGSQGSWPSHPELLDWLAIDFREHDWDVKRTMKQMVMSQTYRQSSKTSPELTAIDPKNRLLSHGPRYRLDAEVIRDQALAVSGLLVEKLGGPGVKPPQPSGLWEAVAYSGSNTKTFVADHGPEKVHRRSVYTFWKRTSPPPEMTTLDAPSRESCVVRRERTNTPLAALMLLNDPQYFEAARALAQRAMRDAKNEPDAVVDRMFELATLREPTDDELYRLRTLFDESLARYESDPNSRDQLLSVGEAPMDDELDHTELASWTLVANAILNLDEVLNKE